MPVVTHRILILKFRIDSHRMLQFRFDLNGVLPNFRKWIHFFTNPDLADRFCGYLFDAPFPYPSTIPPGLAGSNADDANLEMAMWSLCVELTSSAFSHQSVQGVAANSDAKPWQRQKVLTRPKFSKFRPRYTIEIYMYISDNTWLPISDSTSRNIY